MLLVKMTTHIFNADDLLQTLQQAKAEKNFSSVFYLDWNKLRTAKRNTSVKYVTVYVIIKGKKAPLMFNFQNEKHVGTIPPSTDEEVIRMNAENPKFLVKKRDRDPCLQFNKYKISPPLEDDGLTVKKNEQGEEIYPGDEEKSKLFQIIELLEEAFEDAVQKGPETMKTKHVIKLIQRKISNSAAKNADKPLPNPIARIRIKINPATNILTPILLDKSKPITLQNGKTSFEELKDENGVKANPDNIHKLIESHSIHDGIINARSICISNMGISFLLCLEMGVVKVFEKNNGIDVDSIYSSDDISTLVNQIAIA
ncbi:pC312R [African swine fever virus]|uniref:PC312R n=1 Tax=African swine fever virus TaxID=10497 RepID=A0A856Z1R1_ASF|nr:pC312R [African swine fever virus]